MAGLGESFHHRAFVRATPSAWNACSSGFLVSSASLGSPRASLAQKAFLAPSLGWSLVLFS